MNKHFLKILHYIGVLGHVLVLGASPFKNLRMNYWTSINCASFQIFVHWSATHTPSLSYSWYGICTRIFSDFSLNYIPVLKPRDILMYCILKVQKSILTRKINPSHKIDIGWSEFFNNLKKILKVFFFTPL